MFCHNCGKEIDDNARYCQFCGTDLVEKNKDENENKDNPVDIEETNIQEGIWANNNYKLPIKKIIFFLLTLLVVIVAIIELCIMYDMRKNYTEAISLYEANNVIDAHKKISYVNNHNPNYKDTKKYYDEISYKYYVIEANNKKMSLDYSSAISNYSKAKSTDYAKDNNLINYIDGLILYTKEQENIAQISRRVPADIYDYNNDINSLDEINKKLNESKKLLSAYKEDTKFIDEAINKNQKKIQEYASKISKLFEKEIYEKGIYYVDVEKGLNGFPENVFSFSDFYMYLIYEHKFKLYPITNNTELNILVFYIDLMEFPNFTKDILKYSEEIISQLGKEKDEIDIYIYDKNIDLLYLRGYKQDTPADILLELERLTPILHLSYNPGKYRFLSACVLTSIGQQTIVKSFNNGWNWETLGLNKCGYEFTKNIHEKGLKAIIE